ncbi:MAG: response regulator [Planctomycetaceae bacterium]|nr:response regulator [Planctomycetaceae bacterium]
MLVLSRDCDSSIRIGPDITIKILSIRKQRVKIGVDAPSNVRVWRDEIAPSEEDPSLPDSSEKERFPVLVVEDNPDHAELIVRALAANHLDSVTLVTSGAEALGALLPDAGSEPRFVPSLVLLDLKLPDISGIDVLRGLRQAPWLVAVPVVVLTAADDDESVRMCLAAGANAFVTKAAGFAQFAQSIGRIAEFWSQEHRVPTPAATPRS